MKNRNRRRRFIASVEQVESRCLLSTAPQFTIKDLGIVSDVEGINNIGQVVGTVFGKPGDNFSRRAAASNPGGSQLIPIQYDDPNGYTFGYDINDSGQIIATGIPNPDGGAMNMMLYSNGSVKWFDQSRAPTSSTVHGHWINNLGDVVGDNYYKQNAFFFDGTTQTTSLISSIEYAPAINNSKQIAGSFNTAQGYLHSCLYNVSDGSFKDLGTLGGLGSNSLGLTESGQVLGLSTMLDGSTHVFLSDPNGGTLHDLGDTNKTPYYAINDLGEIVGKNLFYDGIITWNLNDLVPKNSGFSIDAKDINNSNQIAAVGTDSSGKTHALLLTPVPPPVAPTITWPNPADIVYGTPLSTTQLDATASVPGVFTYTPAAGTVLHAGAAQTLSATFTPDDTAHYTTVTTAALLNVLPAPLTVTANNAIKVQGQPNPPLSGTITGLVNGDTDVATYSTTATTNSPAWTYPIVPALSDSNYAISLVPGTLKVVPPPITFLNGTMNITGYLDSGNTVDVSIDQTTGNLKVTVNGYSFMTNLWSVQSIIYTGGSGGHDTFANHTNITSTVTAYGGSNQLSASTGVTFWYLYGVENSIQDDGGTNFVYRHRFAVSETGTGTFISD